MGGRPLCRVWLLRTDRLCPVNEFPVFTDCLNEEEHRKANSFSTDALRAGYRLSRGFTKWVLAQECGTVRPTDLVIEQVAGGKPFLPQQRKEGDFNVSHCDGLVVVAVSQGATVGVDAERLDPDIDLSIANSCLSPAERTGLCQLAVEEQAPRFFDHWTLKEAYLKARGVGLSGGLQAVTFDFRHSGTLTFSGSVGSPWSFSLYQLKQWKIALCLDRAFEAGDVVFYSWTPEGCSPIQPRRQADWVQN